MLFAKDCRNECDPCVPGAECIRSVDELVVCDGSVKRPALNSRWRRVRIESKWTQTLQLQASLNPSIVPPNLSCLLLLGGHLSLRYYFYLTFLGVKEMFIVVYCECLVAVCLFVDQDLLSMDSNKQVLSCYNVDAVWTCVF